MTPARQQALRTRHAAFFAHADAPAVVTCGDGWFELLDELFTKLEPLLADTAHFPNPPRLYEIGAAHGRLRIVLRPMTPEMATIVYETRDRTALVCEVCGAGKPGESCPACPPP